MFPNITPVQIIAVLIGATFPILTLLGVDLSEPQRAAIEELRFIALGIFGADAAIRVGRNVGNSHTAPHAEETP